MVNVFQKSWMTVIQYFNKQEHFGMLWEIYLLLKIPLMSVCEPENYFIVNYLAKMCNFLVLQISLKKGPILLNYRKRKQWQKIFS